MKKHMSIFNILTLRCVLVKKSLIHKTFLLMKKISNILLLAMLGVLVVLGACSSDVSEELPSAVSRFTTEYFPGLGVKSYQQLKDGGCIVQLSGGPTLTFDSDDRWLEIDGNGSVLPQVLMYDQLPPSLYEYLQATEQQTEVYEMKRDRYYYKLTMFDTVITYDITTGKITYPGMDTGSSAGSH